jgi:hypothetical protein
MIIRKIVPLILAGFLAVSPNLFSQKRFSAGFYLGSSITGFSGAQYFAEELSRLYSETFDIEFPVSNSPRAFLINGGGFVSYNISKKIALRGGIEYAPQGQKFKSEVYLSTSMNMVSQVLLLEQIIKVTYVEIPLSFQFSTRPYSDHDRLYGYFNLGLSPAFNTSAKQSISLEWVRREITNSGTKEEYVDSDYHSEKLNGIGSFDIGAFGSVGISGGYFLENWFFELKYKNGLKNILENDPEFNFNNVMIALVIGWKFQF